jgi:hypothetical protein
MLLFRMKVSAQPNHPSLTASFPHHPEPNPFRFITFPTLSSHGNSLLFPFQQITHSFLSHGTGPSAPSIFEFRFSNLRRSLSSFFATLTECAPVSLLFATLTKTPGVAPLSSHLELAPRLLPFPLGVTLPQFAQREHRGGRSQRSLSTQTRAARILRTLTSEWRILWPPLPPRLSPM